MMPLSIHIILWVAYIILTEFIVESLFIKSLMTVILSLKMQCLIYNISYYNIVFYVTLLLLDLPSGKSLLGEVTLIKHQEVLDLWLNDQSSFMCLVKQTCSWEKLPCYFFPRISEVAFTFMCSYLFYFVLHKLSWGFPGDSVGKESSCSRRDTGLISRLGSSLS